MWPEVVFFDVGHTLIYPKPSVGRVYADAMRQAGLQCSPEEAEQSFLNAWQEQRRRHGSQKPAYGSTDEDARRWWRKVVKLSVERFGEPDDFEALFEKLWQYFAHPDAWSVYDDVHPVLDRLDEMGMRRGLISNWDSRLGPILKDIGLWERFESWTISSHAGIEKPDPAIFESALNTMSVRPENSVHVGDNYEEDVIGARSAGMEPVWIVRNGGCDLGDPDCHVVTGLDELFGPILPEVTEG